MDALNDFYEDHPCVDWYKITEDKGHSQQFSTGISFWTWWSSIFRMYHQTNVLCKRLTVYEWLDQKWLGIHFLFLCKNHKFCFKNSSFKLLLFDNSANLSWAWQVCGPLKISVVNGLRIQLSLNQIPKYFWNCV